MSSTRVIAIAAAVAAGLMISPAAADAPPLDQQVGELRAQVTELQVLVQDQRTDLDAFAATADLADETARALNRLARTPAIKCITNAEAVRFVRMRINGRRLRFLVDAPERSAPGRKWLALVDSSCMPGGQRKRRGGPGKGE